MPFPLPVGRVPSRDGGRADAVFGPHGAKRVSPWGGPRGQHAPQMAGATKEAKTGGATTASRDVVVKNRQGIHARPSAAFVKLAAQFRCEVLLEKDGESINGKSIMGLLMLAAGPGSRLRIVCEGDDAATAVESLAGLVEGGFGEL